MPSDVEVAKVAIDDFKEIQRYMVLAKKENATETYAELKKISLFESNFECMWCKPHRY